MPVPFQTNDARECHQSVAMNRSRNVESQEAVERQNEFFEPPPKKAKRGKYVRNACAQCKRRKIRCPGGTPCAQCVGKRRNCTNDRDQTLPGTRNTASASTTIATSPRPLEGSDSYELLTRLTSVERQLNLVLSERKANATYASRTPDQSGDAAIINGGSPQSRRMSTAQQQNWMEEPTILDAPHEIRAALDEIGLQTQHRSPASTPAPLTPKPYSTLDSSAEKDSRLWLRTILLSFGIVPEKKQWLQYLELYFAELHILFPFIHPPTVWDTFNYIWQNSLLLSASDLSDGSKETKVSVAIMFLCLANGRCAESSRVDESAGRHSAGWSLYSVAMDLFRDDLDLTKDRPSSPASIQALTLMVVYLFGLGANQQAEKTLAQAISCSHILGLHRQITYRDMPMFEKEISRRLWWSIYVLDRRISLETGRPFIIQDVNTSTEYPNNLSDDRLQHLKQFAETQDESMAEGESETARATPSNIPHLNAMISYSKIVGDIWNVVHCDDSIPLGSRNVIDGYLDPLLEQARRTMPPYLSYQPSRSCEDQFSGMPWSQIKQSLLMHLRYTFLKLMIRNPRSAVVDDENLSSYSTLANDAACCELASSVAALFDAIPNQYPKVSFPFINYLTNATMIMFRIVNKNSDFKQAYRPAIISAVRTLMVACRKTWVSGKLIRTISTLEMLARNMFGPISDLPVPSAACGKTSRPVSDVESGLQRTRTQQVPLHPQQSKTTAGSKKAFSLGTSSPFRPPHHQQQEQQEQQQHRQQKQQQQQKDPYSSAGPVELQTFNQAPAMYSSSTPEHFSWNRSVSLNSPAHPGTTSTGHQTWLPLQPQSQEYRPRESQLEAEFTADLSFLASTSGQGGNFPDLHTWSLADFEFEQMISADNQNASASFGCREPPSLDPNTLQRWGH